MHRAKRKKFLPSERMPLWYRNPIGQRDDGEYLASVNGFLAAVRPWKGLSHVNNNSIAVDVKFVPICIGAGLYTSMTAVKTSISSIAPSTDLFMIFNGKTTC
ncbi:hypothetical protein RF11_14454 [Thelohanellus kitauei]|uniref:Uncharacterized protein n=1 Tax=Thelohanellus kitauei TaxID=669202 RepID=A0A0C2NAV8_THEKT|nr:hypothetical protein RF11_14454 [Thelohanellus kitauei]